MGSTPETSNLNITGDAHPLKITNFRRAKLINNEVTILALKAVVVEKP
jgi:hypothetical protein